MEEFNFNSGNQLKELLYDVLELPPQINEKTKKPSTDAKALEEIEDLHPIVPMLVKNQKLEKVYTSFIMGTTERMVDGRVHPKFNVAGTVTGRISSSDPNLQQLPRDGGVRGIFTPDAGYCFISADYSALEVYVSASLTSDKNLLKIIHGNVSMHDITKEALGIDRDMAKKINFALQYGAQAQKIASILNCSLKEAKEKYDKYWETYSGQAEKMKECAFNVDNGIKMFNSFGRGRMPDVQKSGINKAYRQMWNSCVQGLGSDITTTAFVNVDSDLRSLGIGRGLFTVHDELIGMVRKESFEQAKEIFLNRMIEAGRIAKLAVDLKAEVSGPMDRWED
jgi:DNA polymerase-1